MREMKKSVHYVSDLHLELNKSVEVPKVSADFLILAGDISSYTERERILDYLDGCPSFGKVIYVLGNHEFYGGISYEVLRKDLWPSWFSKNGIELLDNSCVEYEGIKVAGTTLWTDFNRGAAAEFCRRRLADYSKIGGFSISTCYYTHLEAKSFIEQNLDSDLIITHHCPKFFEHSRYPADELTYAFCSTDLPESWFELKHTKWIYGHTHDNTQHHERIFTNQYGYFFEKEQSKFSTQIILEIGK